MKRSTIFLGLALSLCIGTVPAQELSAPEKNFEHLWQTYDRNYALFGAKHIDWDALYKLYRPRVTPQTTDDELFDIFSSLLGHLNDNHVRLQSPTRRFRSGILGDLKMEDFSLDLVKEKYLHAKFQQRMNGVFEFGWLADGVGYFHFRGFGRIPETTAVIDEIIREFKDAKAIVVDVRGNGGGDDRVGKLIADRFADRQRLYMTTQIRNGPRHDDFTAPKYWYVEPGGSAQFTRPVILLTHRYSVSAAENFALAMRVLPHVTVIGDATSGVFADVYGDRLPNGWNFSVSYKLFRDQDGFCWEGIGVPADIRQVNHASDMEQKRDRVLDLALDLVNSGALKPREKDFGSLRGLRASLARELEKNIAQKGVAAAVQTFHAAKASRPKSIYVDQEELSDVAEQIWKAGKKSDAVEVFKLAATEFPRVHETHERLGQAYADIGDMALARTAYAKSQEINRRSYPWEISSYSDTEKILAGKKMLARMLKRDVEEKGVAAAIQSFDQAKAANASACYINEAEINTLGYELLRGGKKKEAIEILKLNAREFPASSNTYDSLGEAYMEAGEKDLAIQNYRKSLELDPKNDNARDRLKRLEGSSGAPR